LPIYLCKWEDIIEKEKSKKELFSKRKKKSNSALKSLCIADDSVEVALWGGYEVSIVHQHCAWELVPTPDAVIQKFTRKHDPG
jgi:hypothetical protein